MSGSATVNGQPAAAEGIVDNTATIAFAASCTDPGNASATFTFQWTSIDANGNPCAKGTSFANGTLVLQPKSMGMLDNVACTYTVTAQTPDKRKASAQITILPKVRNRGRRIKLDRLAVKY